ncbi:AraC family transcriptional regulator [Chryseolinea sp. H1M3-3]|uniref:helix-turn-helix domain-containing protein n=1 Tax=Chryseolinea sp. H1M3-3 TaxID=3034144 RepID=UPI0023EC6999|nr:AraC family transcriptional regulator [Chryseolinea sp. H1M3-3]
MKSGGTFINRRTDKTLQHLVHSFYYQEFNRNVASNSGLIADDGCYEIMFVKETDAFLSYGINNRSKIPHTYTINRVPQPFSIDFKACFTTFCIKLQPWNNGMFFPNSLPQGILDLRTLFGKEILDLHENIFSSKSFNEMVTLAEQFLIAKEYCLSAEMEFVKSVCEKIYDCKGSVSVNELAETFDVPRQILNKIFFRHVKHTVKKFLVLIRMRASIEYKLANPTSSFTEIAYKFGYSDQAHFVNDFRKVCGVTPSMFVKTPSYSCNDLRR